jgi:hypothetical protein
MQLTAVYFFPSNSACSQPSLVVISDTLHISDKAYHTWGDVAVPITRKNRPQYHHLFCIPPIAAWDLKMGFSLLTDIRGNLSSTPLWVDLGAHNLTSSGGADIGLNARPNTVRRVNVTGWWTSSWSLIILQTSGNPLGLLTHSLFQSGWRVAEVQVESEPHHDAAEVNQTVRQAHRFRCQRLLEQVQYIDFSRTILYITAIQSFRDSCCHLVNI